MRKGIDLTKFTKEVTKSLKISTGFNDPTDWISTGNYLLNYFISGNFHNGVPLGKLTMFAGASGCLPKDATVTVRYRKKE